jgi:hypothetical protein
MTPMSATVIGRASGRPPAGAQPWGQATFSAEDFEGDDDDEEDEEDDDEAAVLSPDEDDEEDLSLLPDLSLPPEDDEDESAADDEADEVDAGSEAVDPFRLSVR